MASKNWELLETGCPRKPVAIIHPEQVGDIPSIAMTQDTCKL